MHPSCASCTNPLTVYHYDSQEWICHECGTVALDLQRDVYTDCIESTMQTEMYKVVDKHCRLMENDFSFDSVEDYTHCAQLIYNMNTLSRRESCVLSLCASKTFLEQNKICKSQNVSFNRLHKYMTSATSQTSSTSAYLDVVYHHMKLVASEYGVHLRYPVESQHDVYMNPKKMAHIESIRQFPHLGKFILIK
jgi:hypothetical protein